MAEFKKLLIVSTTFYPHPVVDAVRMTQWCRHLPEFGWRPTVLCRPYQHYATPEQLARDVHPEVTLRYLGNQTGVASPLSDVTRTSRLGSTGLIPQSTLANLKARVKKMVAVPTSLVAVPDVSIWFWKLARKEVLKAVDDLRPDVLLTTSPSHSVHEVGLYLSQLRPHLPWVADFRDPYLLNPEGMSHRENLTQCFHESYEASIYQSAAGIIHAIPGHARWARKRYPGSRQRLRTLLNGAPAEYVNQQRIAPRTRQERTRIVCMGRAPAQLLSLAEAVKQVSCTQHPLTLRFVGAPQAVDAAITPILGEAYSGAGQLSNRQAIQELQTADVLVGMRTNEGAGGSNLSSKLFEYLVLGKPIIMLNPTRADRNLLRGFSGCRAIVHPTPAQLIDAVRWALSDAAQPADHDVERAKHRFSRPQQARELAAYLDGLV